MELSCANCGKRYRVSGRPGKRFKCTKCGNEMTVPDKLPAEREDVAYCSYCWKAYSVKGRPSGTRFNCTSCGQSVTVGAGEKKKSRASRPGAKDEKFHEADTMVMQAAAPADPVAAAERAEQRKELDTAKAELIETRKAYQQAKTVADKAKLELGRLQTDLRQKTEEAVTASARIEELKTKRDGLEKESQRLRTELASATSASAERAGKIKTLEETLLQREETLGQQSRRIEQQSSRIAEIEKELSNRVTKEEMETFHTEKRDLGEKVDNAARKVASFREALKGFLNPAKELARRLEEMQSQASETGLPDLTVELESARAEAQASKEEGASLRAEIESLQAETESLRGEIGKRDALAAQKDQEIARRDRRIEELTRPPEEEEEEKPPSGFFGSLAKKTKGIFGGPKPARPSSRRRLKQKEESEEIGELEEVPEIPPEEPKAEPEEQPTDKHAKVRPRKSRRKRPR